MELRATRWGREGSISLVTLHPQILSLLILPQPGYLFLASVFILESQRSAILRGLQEAGGQLRSRSARPEARCQPILVCVSVAQRHTHSQLPDQISKRAWPEIEIFARVILACSFFDAVLGMPLWLTAGTAWMWGAWVKMWLEWLLYALFQAICSWHISSWPNSNFENILLYYEGLLRIFLMKGENLKRLNIYTILYFKTFLVILSYLL